MRDVGPKNVGGSSGCKSLINFVRFFLIFSMFVFISYMRFLKLGRQWEYVVVIFSSLPVYMLPNICKNSFEMSNVFFYFIILNVKVNWIYFQAQIISYFFKRFFKTCFHLNQNYFLEYIYKLNLNHVTWLVFLFLYFSKQKYSIQVQI